MNTIYVHNPSRSYHHPTRGHVREPQHRYNNIIIKDNKYFIGVSVCLWCFYIANVLLGLFGNGMADAVSNFPKPNKYIEIITNMRQ